MKNKNITLSANLLGIGALFCLGLLIMRILTVFSFSMPRHVVTSGFEEESLFAIWKYVHGLAIYQDPHQIPFAASYFNWLFYQIYGAWTAFFIQIFQLQEAWIPTFTRSLTLLIVLLGGGITYRFLSKNASHDKLTLFSLSVILWGGPLLGFWAMTTRPDVLALFFDVCAALLFLNYVDKKIYLAILFAALGCYLSWACKQINIVMPLCVGLFLLGHQRYKAFFGFSALLVSLYGVTLLIAPTPMMHMLFFIKTAIPFSFSVFVGNLLKFFAKTFPVWMILLALTYQAIRDPAYRMTLWQDNRVKFGLAGLLAWMLTLLPASSKVGSADNYHFICLFFLTLLVSAGFTNRKPLARYVYLSQSLAGILLSCAIVFTFVNGNLNNLKQQHQDFTALQGCLKALPHPTFCVNHYGALPWVSGSEQPFVLAYNYWADRDAGEDFEENGIGGLIAKGYFKSLILPTTVSERFDKGALTRYERQALNCNGYQIYKRIGEKE